jgi:hypothetical protein
MRYKYMRVQIQHPCQFSDVPERLLPVINTALAMLPLPFLATVPAFIVQQNRINRSNIISYFSSVFWSISRT